VEYRDQLGRGYTTGWRKTDTESSAVIRPVWCHRRSYGRASLTERVLILGGYGVFGSRLAIQLLRRERLEVLVAGRDQAKLDTFCTQFGAVPYRLDRDSDAELDNALRELSPTLIVDAAGPFQAYGMTYSLSAMARARFCSTQGWN
jgi:NADPH:quinone reductase-like Zn-dependent oxidoreductase